MHALEIKDLVKSFDGNEVFKDVNMAVKRNSIVCISGPTGCGKTTLLRSIAGLEIPDGGSIAVDDRCVFSDELNIAADQRGIAMVFQGTALWPHMSCGDNIRYCLKGGNDYYEEIVQKTKVSELLDRSPSTLSGGQKQLVALARALAQKPSLLLLDEPLTNIDEANKKDISKIIKDTVSKFGTSCLYVTHNRDDLKRMAKKSFMFKDKILQLKKK